MRLLIRADHATGKRLVDRHATRWGYRFRVNVLVAMTGGFPVGV
jgi:hypothetical protein